MQDCLAPMTGRFHSDETKKLMSIVRLGSKHPLFGKKVSEEVRQKMSESVRGEKHHKTLFFSEKEGPGKKKTRAEVIEKNLKVPR